MTLERLDQVDSCVQVLSIRHQPFSLARCLLYKRIITGTGAAFYPTLLRSVDDHVSHERARDQTFYSRRPTTMLGERRAINATKSRRYSERNEEVARSITVQ